MHTDSLSYLLTKKWLLCYTEKRKKKTKKEKEEGNNRNASGKNEEEGKKRKEKKRERKLEGREERWQLKVRGRARARKVISLNWSAPVGCQSLNRWHTFRDMFRCSRGNVHHRPGPSILSACTRVYTGCTITQVRRVKSFRSRLFPN